MRLRNFLTATLCAALLLGAVPLASLRASAAVRQQQNSPAQRLDVMRSRLETIRRTLNSAIAGLNAKDKGESADDPHARLSGLEKETGKLLNEVEELKRKQEKAERYDPTELDKLETALTDLDNRSQIAMRETAQARSTTAAQADAKAVKKSKKGGGFLGLGKIFGGSGDEEKYAELVGTVAPGRDAQLFGEAGLALEQAAADDDGKQGRHSAHACHSAPERIGVKAKGRREPEQVGALLAQRAEQPLLGDVGAQEVHVEARHF